MKIRDKIFSESLSSMQERLYQEDAHIDILLVKLFHAIKPEVVLHLGSFSHALLCSANLKKISDSEVLYLRHEHMDTGFLDADYINYISHVGLSDEITFIGARSDMFLDLLKRKDIVPDMIVMDQYSEDISPLAFVWSDKKPCLIIQEKPLLSMNKLLLDSPELDILYHQKCLLATNDINFVLPILFGDGQVQYSAPVIQAPAPLQETNVFQRQEPEFVAPQQRYVEETPEFVSPPEEVVPQQQAGNALRNSFYAATPEPQVTEQEYVQSQEEYVPEQEEVAPPSLRDSLRDSFYAAVPEEPQEQPQPTGSALRDSFYTATYEEQEASEQQEYVQPQEEYIPEQAVQPQYIQPEETYNAPITEEYAPEQPVQHTPSGINAENFDISSASSVSSSDDDEFEEVPQEDTEEEMERRKRLMDRMRERQARIKAIKEEVAEEYGVPIQRHHEEDHDYVDPEEQVQPVQVAPQVVVQPQQPQVQPPEVEAQQTPEMPELPTEKTQEDIINAARRAIAMRRAMGDDAQ